MLSFAPIPAKYAAQMKQIFISDTIQKNCPQLILGCITCKVVVTNYNHALWHEIRSAIENIKDIVSLDAVNSIPAIAQTRKAYKALGKEPSRYRPSAEALLRGIAQGKGFYQTNNVVDIINLVSVKTGFSIGSYDASQIKGDIIFDIGKKGEPYEAIGRGALNIHGLPVFRDELGAFGSPTTDSVRTMITPQTQQLLMVIPSFCTILNLNITMNEAESMLTQYATAHDVYKWTVQ